MVLSSNYMGLMVGPMGHSPRDFKLYSKTIVDTKPRLVDPKVVLLPWRPFELSFQLSFAVIKSNTVYIETLGHFTKIQLLKPGKFTNHLFED